jgi:hypothetical protein
VNGLVVEEARAETIAAAIVALYAERDAFEERTRQWFERNRERLSIDASIAVVERLYEEVASSR